MARLDIGSGWHGLPETPDDLENIRAELDVEGTVSTSVEAPENSR